MKKFQVIGLLMFLGFAAIAGGVYQFYFKKKLDTYRDNRVRSDALIARIQDISQRFDHTKPEIILTKKREAIQPLHNIVNRRSKFFALAGDVDMAIVPEEVRFLRFYYEEEYNKAVQKLMQDSWTRRPRCELQFSIAQTFNVPDPGSLQGASLERQKVRKWLQKLISGCYITRMFMDAKPVAIHQLSIWNSRKAADGMLSMYTIGVSFTIQMRDLTAFLYEVSKTNAVDRYMTVDALSIKNSRLNSPTDPYLEVELLLTQAGYNSERSKSASGGAPGAGIGGSRGNDMMSMFGFMGGGRSRTPPKEPTTWEKVKKGFLKARKKVLLF